LLGPVTVTFKAPKKTISTRKAKLSKSCTFKSKVTFDVPSRLSGKLKVVVRYAGNSILLAKSAKVYKVSN